MSRKNKSGKSPVKSAEHVQDPVAAAAVAALDDRLPDGSPDPTAQPGEPVVQPEGKAPFYAAAIQMSHQAGDQILSECPELAAVAVIYVWNIDGRLPEGVLITRDKQNVPVGLFDPVFNACIGFVRNLVQFFFQGLTSQRKAAVTNGSKKRTQEQ